MDNLPSFDGAMLERRLQDLSACSAHPWGLWRAAYTQEDAAAKEAAPVPTPAAPKHDEGEEYVYVELFKDNGRYKDDVLVCVNGESCQIKRGVRVRIKRKFLWAIQNQMRQDANTANMIQEMHEALDDAARANGVKL